LPTAAACFSFTDKGFSVNYDTEVSFVSWNEIHLIVGYKKDLITTDEVCCDIFYGDNLLLRLTESAQGWDEFARMLTTIFPIIKEGWHFDIAFPPFATKLTLLFDKAGRQLDDVMKAFYK
jgi:hypothetical protein